MLELSLWINEALVRGSGVNKSQKVLGFVAGIAVSVSVAMAQPGGGRGGMFGGQNAFAPAVTPTELESYGEILGLDDEQMQVAEILLEGYIQQFQSKANEARSRMERLTEEARETRDRERWGAIGEFRREFEAEGSKMEQTLFSDIRAVLTPEQNDRWEDVERTRRRERTLGTGRMSGERVDLVRLTRELELNESQTADVREVLAQYELDLDRALIKRNDAYAEIQGGFGGGGRGFDPEAMNAMFEKGREASSRVRDINERYSRQVAGLLGDDVRGQFEQRVREASFPQVYRESRAQRSLTAAEGFEDLTADQKEQIIAMKSRFSTEASAMNDKLARAWREAESTMEIRDMFRGGLERGEIGELRDSRDELDGQYMEKLRGLLSEEQLDRLPRVEERRDRQRGGGRQGGQRRGEII